MRIAKREVSSLAEDLFYEYGEGKCEQEIYLPDDAIEKISNLIERPEIYPVYNNGYAVPQVGECVLVNEKACPSFTHEHGGRHHKEHSRRYFGEVTEIHPHIIVLKTHRGMVSERILDFKVGILKYAKLKRFPDRLENISYDDRLLGKFIQSFESLLEQ